MNTLKKLIHHPMTHVALATGFSIIILAYVYKHVLSRPMNNTALAIPPLFMTVHAYVINRYPDSKYSATRYWVSGIIIFTIMVVGFLLLG